MAFQSSDGKSFTNRQPMMSHNRSLERSKGTSVAERKDPLAQPGMEQGGEEDGSSIAQEHGPAHEVHVMHDHEGGQHHVHSMHPDGHEHHSDHESADQAHDHAKKLASAGEEEPGVDEESEPEYE